MYVSYALMPAACKMRRGTFTTLYENLGFDGLDGIFDMKEEMYNLMSASSFNMK